MSIDFAGARNTIDQLKQEVRKVLVGQDEILDQVIAALLASGHVLVEGLPGLGKTLLARALAAAFGGETQRVQFTPDLMPSDLVGHTLYDMASGKFKTRRGPVFTHLLIADEINRAPAKTQAALLEVMQEYQVSLDGTTYPIDRPFLVMATQNPFEHEGTYPLPDAQLDRFLLKLIISYPSEADEIILLEKVTTGKRGETLDLSAIKQVADIKTLQGLQDLAAQVTIVPQILQYITSLVRATRKTHGIHRGAGPRAGVALVRLARAQALQDGRDFVTPDDVKALAIPVLRHRILIDPEWQLSDGSADDIITNLLKAVEAPRS